MNDFGLGLTVLLSYLIGADYHLTDQVMVYGKATAAHEDMILVALSLDPHGVQEAAFEIPLWEWHLPDDAAVEVEDLMRGHRFVWQGKTQSVRLDPADLPFAIWRIAPAGAKP